MRNPRSVLLVVFLCTLPFVSGYLRGDGWGYYAYVRSLVIEGDLHFENEYLRANPGFRRGIFIEAGTVTPDLITATGHTFNHWAVGPAVLWFPFFLLAHGLVWLAHGLGLHVALDGYSFPYVGLCALATALYAFLGLRLSYTVCTAFFPPTVAFLAVLGVWFGSSLPVYMYLVPFMAHAHAAFVVSLLFWYWCNTRCTRSARQWAILGLIGGFAVTTYYLNALLLLLPVLDLLRLGRLAVVQHQRQTPGPLAALGLCLGGGFIGLLPHIVLKMIIHGNWGTGGYVEQWFWTSPSLLAVLFSSEHGLLSWTPLLICALAGLYAVAQKDRALGLTCVAVCVLYWYVVASYEAWHGVTAFGNRFFVSLTPIFILGLAGFLDLLAQKLPLRALSVIIMGFVLWNLLFIFQWGTGLVPKRGLISWRTMAYNQLSVVPRQIVDTAIAYFRERQRFIQHIETTDDKELQQYERERMQRGSEPHSGQ